MKKWFVLVLMTVAFAALGDARFVEAPAECHVPYDNANVDNEFKLQGCEGTLNSRSGGSVHDGFLFVERNNVIGNPFVIEGEDVRDIDAYPSGVLTIRTSGDASGTVCNVVSDGTTYITMNWDASIRVYRTTNRHRVNVDYQLNCRGATAQ